MHHVHSAKRSWLRYRGRLLFVQVATNRQDDESVISRRSARDISLRRIHQLDWSPRQLTPTVAFVLSLWGERLHEYPKLSYYLPNLAIQQIDFNCLKARLHHIH